MIKVSRSPKPRILETMADEWTRQLLSVATKKEKSAAESKYRHKAIKEALIAMFNGKCAYCESKVTHIDYGHIEHYKPKSVFPDSTFDWPNMLLGCGVCNGRGCKGDKFPGASDGGPLLNPCEDDPDEHFEFFYDRIAMLATVIGTTNRGKITESLLSLNRPDLRDYRSKQVKKLYALRIFAQTDAEAKVIFDEALSDNAEYAAFARALARNGI
jgi:uncharacterized protein (TIGR02646 family)